MKRVIDLGKVLGKTAPKYWDQGQFQKLQDFTFTPPSYTSQMHFTGALTEYTFFGNNFVYLLKSTLSNTGMSFLTLSKTWYSKDSIIMEPIHRLLPPYKRIGSETTEIIGEAEACPNHWPIVSVVAADDVANVTSIESLARALSDCPNIKNPRVMIEHAFKNDGTFDYNRLSVMLSRLLKATDQQVSLVDTFGCATPSSVKSLIENIKKDGGAINMSRIAFGFSDSKGMAPFNFLSAVESGVQNHDVALNSSSAIQLFDARKAALLCSSLEIPSSLNYTNLCKVMLEKTDRQENMGR